MSEQKLTRQERIAAGLRSVLADSKGEVSAKRLARVEGNRPRNHMAAVALNAFVRHGQGKELTALEQVYVNVFRDAGHSDEQLAEYGRIFAEASPEKRAWAFPDSSAGLTPETGYGWEEWKRDLPAMVRGILAMPAVRVVDPPVAGQVVPKDPDRSELESEAVKAAGRNGWGATIYRPTTAATAASATSATSVTSAAPALRAGDSYPPIAFWANDFFCDVESTETSDSDEPYFGFACTDGRSTTKYESEVFEDVDKGEHHYFNQATFWHQPVAAGLGGLILTVDAWEEDSGNNEYGPERELLGKFIDILLGQLQPSGWMDLIQEILEAAGDLTELADAAVAAAIAVMGAVSIFMEWAQDDHIATVFMAFTDDTLRNLGTEEAPQCFRQWIDGTDHGEARLHMDIRAGYTTLKKVVLADTDMVLDVQDDSQDDWAPLVVWNSTGGSHQKWRLRGTLSQEEKHCLLVNDGSGKVVCVYNADTDTGAGIIQFSFTGDLNQEWRVLPAGEVGAEEVTLLNANSEKVISVDGEFSNGAKLEQTTYHGDAWQLWRIEDF